MQEDGGTPGALSVDGDFVGITAEVVDVVLDPVQGLNLIQETDVVIRNSSTGEIGMGEESESSQTIVDRDDNNLLALMDPMIVGQGGGVSEDITTSVDVEQYGY